MADDQEREANDRDADRLAAEILDGGPIAWPAASASSQDPLLLEQFRVLADVIALHRSPGGSGRSVMPSGAIDDRQWGPLVIRERVGEGAFGDVYRAYDPKLDREVALKVLRPRAGSSSLESQTWVDEGRLLARVHHPNVVTVYGADRVGDEVGVWMEFIYGKTLDRILSEQGIFSVEETVRIGKDLCQALTAVHDAGLLHCDVKAQNVMRDDAGRVVLMDFGTGRDGQVWQSDTMGIAGTPLYLAPELFQGARPHAGSEIYSLAVLLFHLLTREFPYPGASADDVRAAQARGRPARLRDHRQDLPALLERTIERGLAIDPRERFQNPQAFLAALGEVDEVVAPTASTVARNRSRRQVRVVAAGCLLLGLIGGAAAVRWWWTNRRPAFTVERLTLTGDVLDYAVAPGGKRIASIRRSGPNSWAVWVQDIGTDVDPHLLPFEANLNPLKVTFTPDGQNIDLLALRPDPDRRGRNELWRVAASGGPAHCVVEPTETPQVMSPPGWSPDGQRMAFVQGGRGYSEVAVADADGRNVTILATAGGGTRNFIGVNWSRTPGNRPAWSPDGRSIAVTGLDFEPGASFIALIDVEARTVRDIVRLDLSTHRQPSILEVAWFDDQRLFVSRESGPGGEYQLWLYDIKRRQWDQTVSGLDSYQGVSIAGDRNGAIVRRISAQASLWLGAPDGDMFPVGPVTPEDPGVGSVSDQGDLAYEATTADGSFVWVLRRGQTTAQRVVRGFQPVLLPSGNGLLFLMGGPGRGLYFADLSGRNMRQLASGLFEDLRVARDSARVFFGSWRDLWDVPLSGGTPPRRLRQDGVWRVVGPTLDGHQLVYIAPAPVGASLFVCDLPDCQNSKMVRHTVRSVESQISPGGRVAQLQLGADSGQNIFEVPLDDTKLDHALTHFADARITSFAFSPNGKWLAVSRGNNTSDFVLIRSTK